MSEDAQKYFNAAKRVDKQMLKGEFGSTGIDFSEPRASDPNMRAVLGGFDAANARNTIHGLMTGGDNRSLQQNNMQATDNGMGGSAGKEDEKKKQQELDRLLAQLADLQRQSAELGEKIARNKELMAELEEKIAKSEALDQQLSTMIRDLEDGKLPAKNADGSLQNQDVEAKLREYESKYGVKVDRDNVEALRAALLKIQQDELALRDQWRIDHKRLKTETTDFETRKQAIDTQVSEVGHKIEHHAAVTTKAVETNNLAVVNEAQVAISVVKKEIDFDDLNGDEPVQASAENDQAANMSVASTFGDAGMNAPQMASAFKAAHTPEVIASADLANKLKPVV